MNNNLKYNYQTVLRELHLLDINYDNIIITERPMGYMKIIIL